MSYTDILYRLLDELIKLFRSFEQTKKKEINAKWSIVFNETCIKEKSKTFNANPNTYEGLRA